MKKITHLSIFSLCAVFFLFGCYAHAQDKTGNETIVKIKSVEINNGDTVTEERTLTGKEAEEYMKEHHPSMNIENDLETLIELDMDVTEDGKDMKKKNRVEKKMIIRSSADGDGEKSSKQDKRVIVKTMEFSDDMENSHEMNVVVEDGKVIITNGDGTTQEIILDSETTEMMEKAKGKNGSKMEKRIIIVDKVEIEENDEGHKNSIAHAYSIKDDSENDLKFYPNPNNGNFTLEAELKNKGKAQLRVVDVNGKVVYEETFKGPGVIKKQIDLPDTGKGVYFVHLNQNGEALTQKVVVE